MNKGDIKILLVDDEPDILEIVGYNLKNEGYQVITAENGQEAIKFAKKHNPHLGKYRARTSAGNKQASNKQARRQARGHTSRYACSMRERKLK